MSYITCITSARSNNQEGTTEAEGRAFFSAAEEGGQFGIKHETYKSVEVKVVYHPETDTWTAEIVRQWDGRF